jgi:hypothetical protein
MGLWKFNSKIRRRDLRQVQISPSHGRTTRVIILVGNQLDAQFVT